MAMLWLPRNVKAHGLLPAWDGHAGHFGDHFTLHFTGSWEQRPSWHDILLTATLSLTNPGGTRHKLSMWNKTTDHFQGQDFQRQSWCSEPNFIFLLASTNSAVAGLVEVTASSSHAIMATAASHIRLPLIHLVWAVRLSLVLALHLCASLTSWLTQG